MSFPHLAYLILVVGAFATFMLVLGFTTIHVRLGDRKARRSRAD